MVVRQMVAVGLVARRRKGRCRCRSSLLDLALDGNVC